jgi:hypothetical protein
VAGACLLAALALWVLVGVDAAFVAATLGVVAWFMDQRDRYAARAAEAGAGGGEGETDEGGVKDDEDDQRDDGGDGRL